MASMSRLPAELPARIFILALPGFSPYMELCIREAPLLLTQICRDWRRVALQTAGLWSSLDATQASHSGAAELEPLRKGAIDGHASWLARPRNRLLSLAVPFPSQEYLRREWLGVVFKHRGRFRRLQAVYEAGFDANPLLDGADVLHFLSLKAGAPGSRKQIILQKLPSLRTLVLEELHPRENAVLRAVWTSLTGLSVKLPFNGSYPSEKFLAVASRCPSLQQLALGRLCVQDLEPLPSPPPHSFPKLLSLTAALDNAGGPDVAHVFNAPALQSLKVLDECGADTERELQEDPAPMNAMPSERHCRVELESAAGFQLFDLGWTTLTSLFVKFRGDLDALHKVLVHCPSLQEAALSGRCCNLQPASFWSPFYRHSLKTLLIYIQAPLGDALRMATLPRLESLSITAASLGQHGDALTFVARSQCPLKQLAVRAKGTPWTRKQRDGVIESISALEETELWPPIR